MTFPGTGSIQYLIDPAYYAAVVAGTTLAGYTTWGVAAFTTSVSTDTLGSTGWYIRVYSDGATARATFVWNSTTKEVIFYSGGTNYWDADDVLASFATDDETSFFAAISKTRSSQWATPPGSTAVGGSVSGWSAYHDALVKEMESIQDKYAWQDDAALVARVNAIQAELLSAGSTIVNSPLSAMIDKFDEAYENAKQANLDRYDQLIADAATAPDPLYVMSYPQLAYHVDTAYLTPILSDWENLKTDQLARDDEVIDVLQDDWTELDDRLQQIGDRARDDNSDKFRAAISRAQQGLIDSGVYNSTLNAAAVSGIAASEAAELSRLNESLGGRQVEALSRIQAVRQQARQQRSQNRLAIAQAKLGWRAEAARRMVELYRLAPTVVEGRTDIGPSLADSANLIMQVGKGAGTQQMLNAFQPSQFIAGGGFDFSKFMQTAASAGKG